MLLAARTRSLTRLNSAVASQTSYNSTRNMGILRPTRQVAKEGEQTDTPMLRFESTLPHLPVPTLQETADRYLASIKPFHTSQTPGSPSTPLPSWAKSEQAVKAFVDSPLVQELQKRLEERAKGKESWLSEWWNETAYFGWRGPVVPGVNYFYSHKDDKTRRTGPSRAASLLRALLYFRRLVVTGQLEPEMARKTPLCMSSYKYLFNATRLPTAPSDTAKIYPAEENEHVVVVRKNRFYEVKVTDEKGDWLSEKELESLFQQVIDQVGNDADPNPLGALTAADRDLWTQARKDLLAHDPKNLASLERIESAIIVVSLDSGSPRTRDEKAWSLWVGDGKDRWFDKHQLVVFENGKSGFNGEHSCMDGTPTSRLNDWLCRSLDSEKIDLGSFSRPLSALPQPTALNFSLPTSVTSAIQTSITAFDKTMSSHDLTVLDYPAYGKDLIKTFRVSPDSYAQLTMGLAYFRMMGQVAPTYESAQTRKYRSGRTEVIRSATSAAVEWYKSMEDPKASNSARASLFRAAAAEHIKLATEAADGRGVDRHLFGLKKLLREGEELPDLYKDETFGKSGNWVLSTSQLSSEYFDSWGYGEVVNEGYGLAYAVNSRSLRFCLTSMNREEGNNVRVFKQYLEEAAEDVRDVMEKEKVDAAAGGGEAGKAKL